MSMSFLEKKKPHQFSLLKLYRGTPSELYLTTYGIKHRYTYICISLSGRGGRWHDIKPLEYLWLWYVTVNIKLEALWRIKMIERILKWVNQQKQDDYRMPIFYDTAAFCFKPFLQIVMQYPCFNHGMNIIYSPLAF